MLLRLALLVALAAAALACGGDGVPADAPRVVERVAWRPSEAWQPGGPTDEPETVLAFEFEDGSSAGWRFEDGGELAVDDGFLRVEPSPLLKNVGCAVELDADRVTHASFAIASVEERKVSFHWRTADGEGGLVRFSRKAGRRPREYRIDLAAQPRWRGRIAWIGLSFTNRLRPLGIHAVHFERVDPLARLHALQASTAGRLLLGRQSRPGHVLAPGFELATVPVRLERSTLVHLGVGLATDGEQAPPPRLRVTAGAWSRTLELVREPRWRDLELAIELPGAALVPLEVALEGAAAECVYVEHPRIVRPPRRDAPHVVLITADTLRADYLPLYGDARTRTPVLDELAREGLLFEDVTTACNSTGPSHASIFTALYPKDHGVLKNANRLTEAAVTLAEAFAADGYQTAAAISSTVLKDRISGLGQGFDAYFDAGSAPKRRAERTNADVLPWIERRRGERVFVWVHYMDPHAPYDPPEPYRSWYDAGDPATVAPGDRALPEPATRAPFLEGVVNPRVPDALYRGEISYMDAQLGELLAGLERAGVAERTLLAFTADHGESLGEHDIFFNHEGLFPPTVGVPWILAGPGVPRGVRAAQPVQTVDVAPTLAALAGIPLPAGRRGVDVLGPVLREPGPVQYFQHSGGLAVGLRTPEHHVILGLRPRRRGVDEERLEPGLELFARSGAEIAPLDGAPPALARELEERLTAWLADHHDLETLASELSADESASFEALGYAGY